MTTAAAPQQRIEDNDIVHVVAVLPAHQQADFRSSCRDAANAYRDTDPLVARVWRSFAAVGHLEGEVSKALAHCTRDDLDHIDAVLRGAELAWRRAPRIQAVWTLCRNAVRQERDAAERPIPVPQTIGHLGPRATAVLELIRDAGALPTSEITGRLGHADATRQALQRLRRTGLVELRAGVNHLKETQ